LPVDALHDARVHEKKSFGFKAEPGTNWAISHAHSGIFTPCHPAIFANCASFMQKPIELLSQMVQQLRPYLVR